jgi:hypothetical protein
MHQVSSNEPPLGGFEKAAIAVLGGVVLGVFIARIVALFL